jgi:hypothetical protein
MRGFVSKVFSVLIVLISSPNCTKAQETSPPELTRLFPPGAQRGQTTAIQVQGKFAADSVRVWSSVPGLIWTKSEGENQFQVAIEPTTEIGTALVRLVDEGGASEVLPFVVGHHPERAEVEPNDHCKQAQANFPRPIVISGLLQSGGDVDHFQFSLKSGERLVAFVDAERFLKSAVDATLQLLTVDGQILAQNLDYRGLDPQVVWTADQDIDVVLRVFGFPAAPDSTITLGGGDKFLYRLNVTTGAAIEAIEPLAWTLDQPQRYSRRGWNLPASEEPLEGQGQPSRNALKLSWPDAVGHLTIAIVSHPSWLARDVRLNDHRMASNAEAARALTPPFTMTGNINQPQQVDNFLIQAPEKKQWRVQLEARDLGYAWDPCIEVLQVADGKRVHRYDDQGSQLDPDWTWSPSEGLYQLRVFDLHGHAGFHYWYRLSLTEILPEVHLTVTQTAFRGQVGEVVEIPITIDRRQGFSGDLEFQLVGQSAAITESPSIVEPVRSIPGDDSAKQVTLKVRSASVFSGPIKIQASETTKPEQPLVVVHDSSGLEQFWLAFRAPAPKKE